MILARLLQEATCALFYGDLDVSFKRVVIDSRTVQPGDLFVAIVGQSQDGHSFVQEAIFRGASGVMVQACWWKKGAFSPDGVCIFVVEDSQVALGQMACAWVDKRRQLGDFVLVALTGSHGKTTTKELVASILQAHYGDKHVLKTEGNLNNQLGVPLTLLRIQSFHKVAVVEMGMSFLGEIAYLASLCQPDIGVITHIGRAHLKELGTIEEVAKAKCELFYALQETKTAIYPVGPGHELLENQLEKIPLATGISRFLVTLCSKRSDAHLWVQKKQMTPSGLNVSVVFRQKQNSSQPNQPIDYLIPVIGSHHVQNVGLAIAVASKLGCLEDEVRLGLANVHVEKHRGHLLAVAGRSIIDDCYNAAPDSMKAALYTLEELALFPARKVAILADMLELGETEIQLHEQLIETIQDTKIAQLILYGPNMAFLANQAKQRSIEVRHVSSLNELVAAFYELTAPLDIVLVKGSRGMKLDQFIDRVVSLSKELSPKG